MILPFVHFAFLVVVATIHAYQIELHLKCKSTSPPSLDTLGFLVNTKSEEARITQCSMAMRCAKRSGTQFFSIKAIIEQNKTSHHLYSK